VCAEGEGIEDVMKEGIHPKYEKATVECACGNVIETRSTRGSFKVDICSACHPFFTGKQKLVDSAGRVDRFLKKYGLQDKSKKDAGQAAPEGAAE